MYNFGGGAPYATAVQNAYSTLLTKPGQRLQTPASRCCNRACRRAAFQLIGGVSYLGPANISNWTQGTNRFLPNVSVGLRDQTAKTVLRAGTGWHSDTFNSMNSRPGQNGYSQSTSTILTKRQRPDLLLRRQQRLHAGILPERPTP